MAFDVFLKFKDKITGESVGDGHKDEIDVLAFSWGASNAGSGHTSTGGGTGKANVQDLSITKYVDKATCDLFKACMGGDHFGDAVLTVQKVAGSKAKPIPYLVITMKDVMVTSVSTGGHGGGDDRLTESVTLNFAAVEMKYQKQKPDGTAEKGGQMSWNIAQNKAA